MNNDVLWGHFGPLKFEKLLRILEEKLDSTKGAMEKAVLKEHLDLANC